jgi:hypothetical protein
LGQKLLKDLEHVWLLDSNPVFCTQIQQIAGPITKFFVWQLDSVFVFKSKHYTTNTQIQYFENIFLMFSFLLFCTQVYCLIKKKNIFSLSSETFPFLSPDIAHGRRQSLPRPTWLSVVFAAVTWLRGGRLGFTNLRPISPSPNVARERTDLYLSLSLSLSLSHGGVLLVCGRRWWGFVEFLVEFCWFVVAGGGAFVDFVVGHDGIASGCAFRWVWLLCLVVVVEVEVGVVAGDCQWPAVIVGGCG